MARYQDEQDREAAADYAAEMALQADHDDAFGFIPAARSWAHMSYAEKARAEGFSCYEDGIQNAGCYD